MSLALPKAYKNTTPDAQQTRNVTENGDLWLNEACSSAERATVIKGVSENILNEYVARSAVDGHQSMSHMADSVLKVRYGCNVLAVNATWICSHISPSKLTTQLIDYQLGMCFGFTFTGGKE